MDYLTDEDIQNLVEGIDNPSNVQAYVKLGEASFVCPNCKTFTKRIRISNPNKNFRKAKDYIEDQKPVEDLHIRIIGEDNQVKHRGILKKGWTFCLACKTGWFQ